MNLSREDVDLNLLTELQANKAEPAIAMHGFISWVGANYDGYKILLPQKRRE